MLFQLDFPLMILPLTDFSKFIETFEQYFRIILYLLFIVEGSTRG